MRHARIILLMLATLFAGKADAQMTWTYVYDKALERQLRYEETHAIKKKKLYPRWWYKLFYRSYWKKGNAPMSVRGQYLGQLETQDNLAETHEKHMSNRAKEETLRYEDRAHNLVDLAWTMNKDRINELSEEIASQLETYIGYTKEEGFRQKAYDYIYGELQNQLEQVETLRKAYDDTSARHEGYTAVTASLEKLLETAKAYNRYCLFKNRKFLMRSGE